MILPVIMAGGSGTRLWPLSRHLYPKQLLDLTGDHTMLQHTLLRLPGCGEALSTPMVICNEVHRFMVADQMRSIGVSDLGIILEPVGRNTAPAVAVAALRAIEGGEDPVLLVLPADHLIRDLPKFHSAVKSGYSLATLGHLITFGIVPTAPETGYGYIKKGEPMVMPSGDPAHQNPDTAAARIDRFVEKPDFETAKGYLLSGQYFWNSGMFMFLASRYLAELERHAPEMVAGCREAIRVGKEDLGFFRLDRDAFSKCPSDSIDYAVMEKTDQGAVVPLDAGWNDVGSWEALWQEGVKDDSGNVVRGDVILKDVKDSLLFSTDRLVAAVGLDSHIVIETTDAVFISPRNRVQEVKAIVDTLKKGNRPHALTHRKVYRPWGYFETIDASERFEVKHVTLTPGARISKQRHFHRAEHWIIVRGTARVTLGDEIRLLGNDESIYIPVGVFHRLENPGKIPLEIIEVRTGDYLKEDDIERIEDDYGR
jgi:mannose-1-phosphate guanylyltransferase/mannose-6-phosphate isomerase